MKQFFLLFILFLLFAGTFYGKGIDTVIDTSFQMTESTKSLDSLKQKVKRDTLVPIHQSPFYIGSYFLSNETLTHNDYRYTGDFLKTFPFTFLRDRGMIGQPNNIYIYGYPNSSTSYMENGVLLNDRSSNEFDPNIFESEFIDSIEITPAPRSFLYGNFNSFSTVNFITKDLLTAKPLSRVRYYQGANGEIFVDGFYNGIIAPKLKLTFDLQNRNFDSTYSNSSYTNWIGNLRLKYYLSNKVNIIAGYNYAKSNVGLNGGVDVENIDTGNSNINNLLYDEGLAPVNYSFRKEEMLQDNYNLEVLALPFKNAKTDFKFYYQFHQNKLNNISDSVLENKYKMNTFGFFLNQDVQFGPAGLKILANYEKSKIENSSIISDRFNSFEYNDKTYSAAAILSFNTLPDSSLVPSVFFKYGDEKIPELGLSGNWTGFGADVLYKALSNVNLYFGVSRFENAYYPDGTFSSEAGINYKIPQLTFILKAFNYGKLAGIGSNLNFQISKVLVESNSSFYFNSKEGLSANLVNLPKVKFVGGIYYKDILFHENLNLKTGFVFNYYGTQAILQNELINNTYPISQIDPSLRIDFTLVGEIQQRAIIYFTLENLLDRQYYLEPYYPMRSRNVRFGIGWTLFN
jgi:TonB-dependent Receptor Plug Domain/Putative porin